MLPYGWATAFTLSLFCPRGKKNSFSTSKKDHRCLNSIHASFWLAKSKNKTAQQWAASAPLFNMCFSFPSCLRLPSSVGEDAKCEGCIGEGCRGGPGTVSHFPSWLAYLLSCSHATTDPVHSDTLCSETCRQNWWWSLPSKNSRLVYYLCGHLSPLRWKRDWNIIALQLKLVFTLI